MPNQKTVAQAVSRRSPPFCKKGKGKLLYSA